MPALQEEAIHSVSNPCTPALLQHFGVTPKPEAVEIPFGEVSRQQGIQVGLCTKPNETSLKGRLIGKGVRLLSRDRNLHAAP